MLENSKNTTVEIISSPASNWRTYARHAIKATTVFVTAIGGYLLSRGTGWLNGKDTSNPTSAPADSVALRNENVDFSGQHTPLQLTDITSLTVPVSGFTEFSEQTQIESKPTHHRFNKRAIGAEFQVNTYTLNAQDNPIITPLNNGNVMVIWESGGQDGSNYGIYGQVLTETGMKVGTEFQVNTYALGDQRSSDLTVLINGNVMVSWQSAGQDGEANGIYGQVLTETGMKVGAEFQVNTYTLNHQISPALKKLGNGYVMVVWESGHEGSGHGIYGQVLTETGTKVGAEFQVNTYTLNHQLFPALLVLNSGNVMVIWQSEGQDGSLYGIYGQVLTQTGAKIGAEFQVNTYTLSSQQYPTLAALSNGNAMVIWGSYGQDGDGYGIYGQVLTETGAKVGAEFQVNTYTLESQSFPGITMLNGNLMVTWESNGQDGGLYGIYGQVLTETGMKVGAEFQVNTYTLSQQVSSALTVLSNRNVMVIWASSGQDGNSYGIYGRVFGSSLDFWVNQLSIQEDETKVLKLNELSANFLYPNYTQVQFTVNQIQHGFFIRMNTTQSTTQFGQQDIDNGLIQFMHDGSEIAPSYNISLSDGSNTTPSQAATIFFTPANDAPTMVNNQLTVTNGGKTILSSLDLSAEDVDTDLAQLQFNVVNLTHGIFTYQANEFILLTNFSQSDVINQKIIFIHDDTGLPPSYAISVNDGNASSPSIPANITFVPKDITSQNSASQESQLIGIILGVLAAGIFTAGFGVGLLAWYRYRKQKAKEQQTDIEIQMLKIALGLDATEKLDIKRFNKVNEGGRTIIGGKWALIKHIRREEAEELKKQTGYHVDFPDNSSTAEVAIGQGHFGKVRLAKRLGNEEHLAGRFAGVKKVKGESKIKASLQEASIQVELHKVPHIMPLFDALETEGSQGERTLYQFMLFAGFGSGERLQKALAAIRDEMQKEKLVLSFAEQILEGFIGMHGRGIYHRDFKPSNWVLDNQGESYIIDFGCAVKLEKGHERINDYQGDLGDMNYFSPERLSFYSYHQAQQSIRAIDNYSAATNDMWTVGMTLYELAANESLFNDVDLEEELELKGEEFILNYLKTRPAFRKPEAHPLWQLLMQLLAPEAERLNAKQALAQLKKEMKLHPEYQFESKEAYQSAFKSLVTLAASELTRQKSIAKAESEKPKLLQEKYKDKIQAYKNKKAEENTKCVYKNESAQKEKELAEEENLSDDKSFEMQTLPSTRQKYKNAEEKPFSQDLPFTFMPAPRQNNPSLNSNSLPSASNTPGLSNRPAEKQEET